MTKPEQPVEASREPFLAAARRELIAFETKERELQKRMKLEEALKFHLPMH
jgi:hypothetical protein